MHNPPVELDAMDDVVGDNQYDLEIAKESNRDNQYDLENCKGLQSYSE